MTDRRPTERLITADDLPDRDMWYDPEELDPYMDDAEKRIEELKAKIKSAAEDIESSDDWHTCGTDMAEGLCAACNLAAALRDSCREGNLPAEEDT
jgi:cell division septum initiation protein DivIVA